MKKLKFLSIISIGLFMSLSACSSKSAQVVEQKKCEPSIAKQEWVKDAVVYEVNLRQFTEQGTIVAFQEHLPYLKELGVDVLWLMPVHPIAEKNRKGEMGSYYAVQDYVKVNPEFGTIEDFKTMVNKAHELGMKVIIDWVANHTGCDNVWVEQHPDWFNRDSLGNIISPWDWTDTYDLNYDKQEVRTAMTDAMKFWVEETNIDGFRCDVAFLVPTDFWDSTRVELEKIKPMFMLAEAETPELTNKAFDAVYNWQLGFVTQDVYKGKKNAKDVLNLIASQDTLFPCDALQMNFITNHDRNSWDGTEFERYGESVETMAIMSYVFNGMPLIYTGQETGMNKRLEFFKKDTAPAPVKNEYYNFYQKLNELKHSQKALKAGIDGGEFTVYANSADSAVIAVSRKLDTSNEVLYITNLSSQPVEFSLTADKPQGSFKNHFTNEPINFDQLVSMQLKPWEYLLLVK